MSLFFPSNDKSRWFLREGIESWRPVSGIYPREQIASTKNPIDRTGYPIARTEFHGPITEIINQGLTGTFYFNPSYHFVNGRAYPRPHTDDYDSVLFEGADLSDIRQQVQYLLARNPTANPKFLLQEPKSHICTHTLPPQRRAQTFLMYMFGQSLVANAAGSVHLWCLHLFREFLSIEGMNWAGLGLVTLCHSMNLFSQGIYNSHIGMSYLWEPLQFSDINWPFQNLYRATNRRMGHLVTLEQVRVALDGLKEAQALDAGPPLVVVETMQATAIPDGYTPLTADPEVPPLLSPVDSLDHPASLKGSPDEGHGDYVPMEGTNFGGFDFSESAPLPLPHPRENPLGPPYFDMDPSLSDVPLLIPPPTFGAEPSHGTGPSYPAGPFHQAGPTYPTYHLPAIPYSYSIIQDGVVGSRDIPLNLTPCQLYFSLLEGMLDHEMGTFYTREIQDAYMAASSWFTFETD
ncbi:hypothetical protein LguiA_003918 [Lonicera macranthoides]